MVALRQPNYSVRLRYSNKPICWARKEEHGLIDGNWIPVITVASFHNDFPESIRYGLCFSSVWYASLCDNVPSSKLPHPILFPTFSATKTDVGRQGTFFQANPPFYRIYSSYTSILPLYPQCASATIDRKNLSGDP